jgi:type IV pilus assembly protein PilB
MVERQESPSSQSAQRSGARVAVRVSVGPESADQVVLANGAGHVTLQLRTLKGRDVELVGGTFFPKQCQLQLELTSGDSGGAKSGGARLKGVVRKVQTISTEPSHSIWVHLAESDPACLAELQAVLAAAREQSVEAGAGSKATGPGALLGGAPAEEALVSRAMDLGVPFVDTRLYEVQLSNGSLVPEELALRHGLFPLFYLGGAVTLGMNDPGDLAVVDQVRLRTGSQVDPCLCSPAALEALIARAYRAVEVRESPGEPETETAAASGDDSSRASNTVVRLVRTLIDQSARDGASDIHIEPERDFTRVRLRVDGILHEKSTHPAEQHAPLVSRIKVLAKMDISEVRRPQDGHFSTKLDQRVLDVRVSTIPTVHGENVVLRLLLSGGKAVGLHELGLPEWALRRMEEFLEHPNGMILVTGPTGSGKTTTLYAALARLSTIERNVVTIEDPVERRMPLLRQTQVNTKAGITFAAGLRSILRQDPDVIMVGEIRDQETAEIAVQAALTGHLVLSTLHTNSAAGAVVRLSEMGIPPFLITSSLRAVISQRLTRRICPECREPASPDPRLVAGLGLDTGEPVPFLKGAGCARCLHTGYRGRVGIYEMLQITPGLGRALLGGGSRDEIEREGQRALLCGLRDDGLRKVREGLTTVEEIARVVGLQHFAAQHEG